jgi:hypothetical protein
MTTSPPPSLLSSSSSSPQPRRRGPLAEPLEARRLFAVNLTDGTLAIVGTDQADVISVTARNGTLTVRLGAERSTFAVDAVDEVLISSLGGDDRITLSRLDIDAVVDGGAGDDRITGGRGNDVLAGGDGDDRISGGSGNDELFGDAGRDRLFGDAGDDELSGGDGADLLNGGFGFDSTELNVDTLTGVEDLGDGRFTGGGGNGGGGGFVGREPTFEDLFGPAFNDAVFFALRDEFLPLDTTGFVVRPGTNVISSALSGASFGNSAFVNPNVGVTLEAGGAVITLPGTGAYARELGLRPGSAVVR